MFNIPLREYMRLLVRYLRPQGWRVVVLGVLLLGGIGLQLVNPQILAQFVDGIQSGAPYPVLLEGSVFFLAVALVQQVVGVGTTYVSENVAWAATNNLRTDLLAHTLDLGMEFHKGRTPGEMIERVDGDVTALSNFFSQFVIQVLGNVILVAGVIVVLARQDWRLGLVVGAFAVSTLLLLGSLRNIGVRHWTAEREASAAFFGFLEERLAGTEDIRANGAQAYVRRRFFALMRDQLRKSLKAGWMINILLNANMLVFALGLAGSFAVGTYLFQHQIVTIGAVFLVYRYTYMLEQPLRAITHQLQELQRAGAGVGRVRELLSLRKQLPDVTQSEAQPFPRGAPGVLFDHVTFTYEDAGPENGSSGGVTATGEAMTSSGTVSPAVLQDVTFSLAPGRVLGLLGRTGSGKTTIARLLMRLYDPDSGTIHLIPQARCDDENASQISGGVALQRMPIQELREHVGIVTQEVHLFTASVRDNLTLFDPTIADSAIHDALNVVGLDEWLRSLPQGLDTVLEAGSGGLSAGEAQLLVFTRICLQNPDLVILDEASSRLDPATEQRVEQALDRLLAGRTAIIIAHRLATVQRADEILILEKGQVIEHGERVELAARAGSHFHQLLSTGLEEVMG